MCQVKGETLRNSLASKATIFQTCNLNGISRSFWCSELGFRLADAQGRGGQVEWFSVSYRTVLLKKRLSLNSHSEAIPILLRSSPQSVTRHLVAA